MAHLYAWKINSIQRIYKYDLLWTKNISASITIRFVSDLYGDSIVSSEAVGN